ncbi:MAG TPA: hypothetical protein VMZ92_08230 [Planctomycetota bacterium]|nr:hypothetical protein [Planctomycetota bacterium]
MPGLLAILTAEVTPVLGQLSRAHEIYRRPKGDSRIGTAALLFILVILLLVLAYRVGKRFFVLVKEPGPTEALFAELARAHGLSAGECKVLRRLARREKLANPVTVFVVRRHLQTYAESNTNAAYRKLYEKLFVA